MKTTIAPENRRRYLDSFHFFMPQRSLSHGFGA